MPRLQGGRGSWEQNSREGACREVNLAGWGAGEGGGFRDRDADRRAGRSARSAGKGGPRFRAEPVGDPEREKPGPRSTPPAGAAETERREGEGKGDKSLQRVPSLLAPGPLAVLSRQGAQGDGSWSHPHLWGGASSVPREVRSQPPMVGHDLIASGGPARSLLAGHGHPVRPQEPPSP